jgi:hypothetical protein
MSHQVTFKDTNKQKVNELQELQIEVPQQQRSSNSEGVQWRGNEILRRMSPGEPSTKVTY